MKTLLCIAVLVACLIIAIPVILMVLPGVLLIVAIALLFRYLDKAAATPPDNHDDRLRR